MLIVIQTGTYKYVFVDAILNDIKLWMKLIVWDVTILLCKLELSSHKFREVDKAFCWKYVKVCVSYMLIFFIILFQKQDWHQN